MQKSGKYCPSKPPRSKSKTKETTDRFKVGSTKYTSASLGSHSRNKNNFCETRILPNEPEVCERLFATKDGILRLSCEKRRILIGEVLPTVNETNYIACPASRIPKSQRIRKIEKVKYYKSGFTRYLSLQVTVHDPTFRHSNLVFSSGTIIYTLKDRDDIVMNCRRSEWSNEVRNSDFIFLNKIEAVI